MLRRWRDDVGRTARWGNWRGDQIMRAISLAIAVVSMGLACCAAALAAGQARIVSLNLCTDQLLVDLVPAANIAALSRLAADPKLSTIAARAQTFRSIGGSAEEVLALDPDLVVTSDHAAPATVALLRRLGRRVVTVPLASDFDGYKQSVRALAEAVGDGQRGERLIADFEARIWAASARARRTAVRPTALAWEVNRLAAGGATLIDAAMQAAGLDNAARRAALGPGGTLPLESIVFEPPDVLVLANAADDYRTAAADNLRHPALARAMRGREILHLPMPLWLCATPRTADAVELLAAARERAELRLAGIADDAERDEQPGGRR